MNANGLMSVWSAIPAAKTFSKADTLRLDPATLARWKEAVEFAGVGVDPRKIPVATGTLKPVGPMLAVRESIPRPCCRTAKS